MIFARSWCGGKRRGTHSLSRVPAKLRSGIHFPPEKSPIERLQRDTASLTAILPPLPTVETQPLKTYRRTINLDGLRIGTALGNLTGSGTR